MNVDPPSVEMKTSVWALLLPAVLANVALAAKFPASVLKAGGSLPGNIVPNQFIVEVDSASDIPSKRDGLQSREVCGRASASRFRR